MSYMPPLTALHVRNERVFASLYDRYWRRVYRFSQIYLNDPDDIEEVVQDVFLKLWQSAAVIDGNKDIEGLLFIITRNLIFDRYRKSLNKSALKFTALEVAEGMSIQESDFEMEDLRGYIDKLIEALPPRQKEVFKMSRKEHLTTKEIAEKLSITDKAVERNIYLSLKFLRQNLHLFILFMSL